MMKEQDADSFVRLIPQLSARARRRWGEWFVAAGNPATAKLFPPSAGPNSAKHVDLLLPLLSNDNEALWVQWYFERVSPLPARHVPTVVGLLRRSLNRPQRGNRGGGGAQMAAAARRVPGDAPPEPALPTPTHLRYAVELHRRFSSSDEVKGFFRDYPSVAARVLQEIETDAKKSKSKKT
jgi:hypothetical protein